MSRQPSADVAIRNAQIRIDAGTMSQTALAAKYGLSRTMIGKILAEEIEVPDEENRAWILALYQGGLDKLEEIIASKGRPITSGAGKHVIDETTGEPAFDTSVIVDALRTKGQYLKDMAKLLAAEKIPTKVMEETKEWLEAIEAMRETTRENTALKNRIAALQNYVAELEAREHGGVQMAEVVED